MTGPTFGAQLLTLPQIFADRLFTIPDYQRGYAWEERQVAELLKDLDHMLRGSVAHRHYTGTLVLGRPKDGAPGEYHVVDGQQRLTTIVILLRLLADHLPEKEQPDFGSLYIRRGDIGSDRAVLRLNSDTRQFFERVVLANGSHGGEPVTLEAHERLHKARKLIEAWIGGHINSGVPVQRIKAALEKELGFLVYAPAEDAETGIMFEVINNRGKPLSELEKVKNYLIYACVKLGAKSLRADIDEDWSAILKDLNAAKKTSPSDEGAFLRYCMVVHFKLNKTDSQYGYDQLKKRMEIDTIAVDEREKNRNIEAMSAFVKFVKLAALWYARLYGKKHERLDPRVVAVLENIRGQERHASIMPLFLALVIGNDGRGEPLTRLLGLLERVNFRVYMARNITKRNDTGQGELYGYAAAYYHKELLASIPVELRNLKSRCIESEHDALEYKLVDFGLEYAPDSMFEASFSLDKDSYDDFYCWSGLRYFFVNYEQEIQPNKTIQIDKITTGRSEGKSADYLSIEHLWAVDHRSLEGENNRASDKFEKRRLGNFVLLELRLNIQAGKSDLSDKIANYVGNKDEPSTDLEQVRKIVKDARLVLKQMHGHTRSKNYYRDLHRKINDLAEKRLVKFALKRWSLKEYLGFEELRLQAEAGWEDDE